MSPLCATYLTWAALGAAVSQSVLGQAAVTQTTVTKDQLWTQMAQSANRGATLFISEIRSKGPAKANLKSGRVAAFQSAYNKLLYYKKAFIKNPEGESSLLVLFRLSVYAEFMGDAKTAAKLYVQCYRHPLRSSPQVRWSRGGETITVGELVDARVEALTGLSSGEIARLAPDELDKMILERFSETTYTAYLYSSSIVGSINPGTATTTERERHEWLVELNRRNLERKVQQAKEFLTVGDPPPAR